MFNAKKLSGIALATAAAGLFAAAAVSPSFAGSDKVRCYGVNGCKGKGACKTAENACKGQNACKGKGVTPMSAKDCKAKGGKDLGAKS